MRFTAKSPYTTLILLNKNLNFVAGSEENPSNPDVPQIEYQPDFELIFQELHDWEIQLRDVDFDGLDDWPDDDDPGDGEIGTAVDLQHGGPKPC